MPQRCQMLHSLPDAVFVVNADGLEQPSRMIDINGDAGNVSAREGLDEGVFAGRTHDSEAIDTTLTHLPHGRPQGARIAGQGA
jgi:hypothetical protein